ncbi:unnamed protein product [Rotaria sordida]|nr:unnamed protein product [Rotaria sordida]CAF1672919.1 unnamed protein product [Rotaria sordida]
MREFRSDLINELLNEYLIPSKMRVFLTSKEFLSIAREKEKWYGTQYKQEYLSEELIKQYETCEINCELYLPIPNKFIPTDFQLFSKEKNLTRPQIPTKIKLSISGFNHKIKELLNLIIDHMINIKVEVEKFEIIKEKVKQSLQFFRRCVPSAMANSGLTYLTAEYDWNNNELLSCLDDITMHDVESFIARVLKRFYIDSLMYGNLTKNQAIEYMTLVE